MADHNSDSKKSNFIFGFLTFAGTVVILYLSTLPFAKRLDPYFHWPLRFPLSSVIAGYLLSIPFSAVIGIYVANYRRKLPSPPKRFSVNSYLVGVVFFSIVLCGVVLGVEAGPFPSKGFFFVLGKFFIPSQYVINILFLATGLFMAIWGARNKSSLIVLSGLGLISTVFASLIDLLTNYRWIPYTGLILGPSMWIIFFVWKLVSKRRAS